MAVQYQTNLATSDNQDLSNSLLTQIQTSVAAIAGSDSSEVTILNSILAAFSPLATAAKQDTAQATLASILSALSGAATAANQSAANASLASILSGMATAAGQASIQTSLDAMSAKLNGPSSGVITDVTQSTSSQSVLAANANRRGLYLYNDTGAKCYVAFAATATTAAFTFLLAPNSGYESPQAKVYTGVISAIFSASGSGKLHITELT